VNQYLFKRSTHLKAAGKEGRNYLTGIHKVPEEHEFLPQFLLLVAEGWIDEVSGPRAMMDRRGERRERLLEKLVKRKREFEKKG
jgi:hypothetical protein